MEGVGEEWTCRLDVLKCLFNAWTGHAIIRTVLACVLHLDQLQTRSNLS